VKAVIVESFERIHRSNLVGMGVLPLQFRDGVSRQTLKLTGAETLDITGVEAGLKPRMMLTLRIHDEGGGVREEPLVCRVGTLYEKSVIVSAPGPSAMKTSNSQPAELSGISSPTNPAAAPKVSAIPAKRPKAPTSGG